MGDFAFREPPPLDSSGLKNKTSETAELLPLGVIVTELMIDVSLFRPKTAGVLVI
jgi:hypothetical protein